MAKLVVSILMSLDGYCAGPEGQLDGLPMGEAFDAHNLALMRHADTFLFGATGFPLFEGYWPTVDRSPQADPVPREISERFEAGRKIVVSDKLAIAPTSPWADAEVVRRSGSHARIADLKAMAGKDMLIFGSHVLVNDLLAAGLVDEFHLLVANTVLGEGLRTFEPGTDASFKPLEIRQLEGSGIVAVHYECRRG